MKPRIMLNANTPDVANMIYYAYRNSVQRRGKELNFNDDLKNAMQQIAEQLTKPTPEKFFIILCGLYGNGKTTMLKALLTLFDEANKAELFDNKKVIDMLTAQDIAKRATLTDLKLTDILLIDDLGNEPAEVKSYGNVYTPLTEILESRYDKQHFTVITTNLTAKEISDRYGKRIADRLEEVSLKIIFKNSSYRINK